jgi:hypothetical protein
MADRRVFCSCEFLYESLVFDTESELVKKLWYSPVIFYIDECNYEKKYLDELKDKIKDLYIEKIKLAADEYLTQIDFRIDNKSLLTEERIYEFCNDVFIIDENDDFCDSLTKKFGVLIVPEKTLKNLELIFKGIDCIINDPLVKYIESENILPGWDSALTKESILPKNNFIPIASNAILICDLYLLAHDPLAGIENIKSLINFFIKNNPNAPVDVTLFTMIRKPKGGKNLFSLNDAKKCVESINEHFKNVNFDIFIHQEDKKLHGRVIITNFYFSRDPEFRGFQLFKGPHVNKDKFGHLLSGELEINGAFKYKLSYDYKGALHKINDYTDLCRNLKDSIHRVKEEARKKGITFVDYIDYIESPIPRKGNKYNRLLYNSYECK